MIARRATVGTAVLAVVLLAACGSSSKKSATSTARPVIAVEAQDFGFVLPRQLPSGWVDITLHNTGKQDHQVAFVKLGSLSFADFKKAAAKNDFKSLPADAVFAGGPNNAGPGESVRATVHLDSGPYAVVCFIPDPKDGKSHAAKGMVVPVEVAPAVYSVEQPPAADGHKIEMTEFAFNVEPAFVGRGNVEITNVGAQVHEVVIYRIADGKTLDDVKKFLLTAPGSKPPSGPPPFTPAGGVAGVGPKQTVYQAMILPAGRYAMFCFFPDPASGLPHAVKGMIKEFTLT